MAIFSHPSRRLLDLLQVRYVLSSEALADPGVGAELVDGQTRDTGEIGWRGPLSGTFTVRDLAINRLDVRWRVYEPGRAQGALRVRLWRGAADPVQILEARVEAATLQDQQVATFYFAPEQEAPGGSIAGRCPRRRLLRTRGWGSMPRAMGARRFRWMARSVAGLPGRDSHRRAPGPLAPRLCRRYRAHPGRRSCATARLLDDTFDLRNAAVSAEALGLPPRPPCRPVARSSSPMVRPALSCAPQPNNPGCSFSGTSSTRVGTPTSMENRLPVRVNQIMRGVLLPAGTHEVICHFEPAHSAWALGWPSPGWCWP